MATLFNHLEAPDRLASLPLLSAPGRPTGDLGPVLGIDIFHQTVPLDPWRLKEQRGIKAPSFVILGELDHGKTTFNLTWMQRLMLLSGRDNRPLRIVVEDSKLNDGQAEYGPVVQEKFGAQQLEMINARLNIFDPEMRMTTTQKLRVVESILEHLRERPIEDRERAVLTAGLRRLEQLPPKHQTPQGLMRLINDPTQIVPTMPDGTPIRVSRRDYEEAAELMVHGLGQLYGGRFGYMFGGEQSLADYLQQPVVSLDYSNIDERQLSLLLALIFMWRAFASENKDERFRTDVLFADENHEMWKYPAYARAMHHMLKILRASGVAVVLNSHRINDYRTTESPLAMNALSDIGGWFIGRQEHRDAIDTVEFLRLPKGMVETITSLKVGNFVFAVPGRSHTVFKLLVSEEDLALSNTNAATERMLGA